MRLTGLTAFTFIALATSAAADDVTDAIDAAREAYDAGDIRYTLEELNFAVQLLNEMKAGNLQGFLPEPLDGWSREIDNEMAAGMAMMGGGVGASAQYSTGEGDSENYKSFTVTVMADNPMVAAVGGMLGNAALVGATGGKIIRVGREKFVIQNGQEMSALVGNRVLVQAQGNDQDAIIAHLETMNFRAMADFGN